MMKLVFLAVPCGKTPEIESYQGARAALRDDDMIEAHAAFFAHGMTCKNMNDLWCECRNRRVYHYFAMQHADVAPDNGWLGVLIEEMETHNLDFIHAPCAFGNGRGITSTGIGYSDDIWAPVRRITTSERLSMPGTWDLGRVKAEYDGAADRILPNTGCAVWKIGEWFDEFRFTMIDRIVKHGGKLCAQSVSEDYVWGHWAHERGLRVGFTNRVATSHYKRVPYSTKDAWGAPRDEEYYRDIGQCA